MLLGLSSEVPRRERDKPWLLQAECPQQQEESHNDSGVGKAPAQIPTGAALATLVSPEVSSGPQGREPQTSLQALQALQALSPYHTKRTCGLHLQEGRTAGTRVFSGRFMPLSLWAQAESEGLSMPPRP